MSINYFPSIGFITTNESFDNAIIFMIIEKSTLTRISCRINYSNFTLPNYRANSITAIYLDNVKSFGAMFNYNAWPVATHK